VARGAASGGLARRLDGLSLATRLLLIMLALLVLSMSALFLLHLYSQRDLLAKIRDYTDELSLAIEITQAQPGAEGDAAVLLQAYAEKLRKLGVKDVTLADASDAVQASTNPQVVGSRLVRARRRGPREYVIRGVLGDDSGPPGSQRTSTLVIPLVVGDRRVGTLLVTRILDDFSALAEEALAGRIVATLVVFALGMLAALYLSWSVTRPLQRLTAAARQVAGGDLSVQVPPGGGKETSSLARSFNEMVARLREQHDLEARLHFAERSTAMGRLASALAHEIRNPLNFINLSIDHARERLAPEDEARRRDFERVLTAMKSEISRLNRLVVDFLSFGKPARLEPRLCSLEPMLREVAALVEPKARDQGIDVRVEAQPGLPRIVADPELLKTCVLNLMLNAVDAMPGGGVLRLDLRREDERPDAPLVVEVADTGVGMSAEAVRSAFEPYFSTKETGVGLGLALTRKIVSDHGGTITLDSAPGRGTLARLVLPLAAPERAAREAPAAPVDV
jgi:hypothetical protein